MQEAADVLGELEDLRDRLQASEQARSAAEASRPSPESGSPDRHAADSQDLAEKVRVLRAELQVRALAENLYGFRYCAEPHILASSVLTRYHILPRPKTVIRVCCRLRKKQQRMRSGKLPAAGRMQTQP